MESITLTTREQIQTYTKAHEMKMILLRISRGNCFCAKYDTCVICMTRKFIRDGFLKEEINNG
jgi:hypothetical protein